MSGERYQHKICAHRETRRKFHLAEAAALAGPLANHDTTQRYLMNRYLGTIEIWNYDFLEQWQEINYS